MECDVVRLGEKKFLWKVNKEGTMVVCLLLGVTGFSCQQKQSQSLHQWQNATEMGNITILISRTYYVCSLIAKKARVLDHVGGVSMVVSAKLAGHIC